MSLARISASSILSSISKASLHTMSSARAPGGGGRPFRGPPRPKPQGNAPAAQQRDFSSSLPALAVPAPGEGATRFRDIPGLHPELLKAIPYEHCTDVSRATPLCTQLIPGSSRDTAGHPRGQRCPRAGQDGNGKDARFPHPCYPTPFQFQIPFTGIHLDLHHLPHARAGSANLDRGRANFATIGGRTIRRADCCWRNEH